MANPTIRKLILYTGTTGIFTKNHFYTVWDISDATGLPLPTVRSRVRARDTFDEKLLELKPKSKTAYPLFKHKTDRLSAKWLKRRIV
ncbi:hypothetical protein [uncultured Mediterranean phage uvMED]|nr:hypothetical protein [uncultured Mediterranean phage uvMED]